MSIQSRFPPHPLREYAMLADNQRAAICGPHGDLVWLCAPQWQDDAVFSALLGGSGVYAISPVEPFTWGGYYESRSLIWHNRWITTSTIVECRDALAYPGDPERVVVLRQLMSTEDSPVHLELDIAAGFGAHRMRELHQQDGCWTGRSGPFEFRWRGAERTVVDTDGVLRGELDIAQGQRHDLVLEISRRPLPPPPHPVRAWRETENAWDRDVPRLQHTALGSRDAQHAYAVLRGMTKPEGGMAAAATMALPERAEQERNYDYRYSWIRDQCYAAIAVATHPLLDDATSFITERLLANGQLAPAYTLDGAPIPEETEVALPGYPGASHVVRGNRVNRQNQLDTYGEVLQLLATAAEYDRLGAEGWSAVRLAVRHVAEHWREGAFLLCGFVLALADQQQGNTTTAVRWYERTRCAYGPPGLFAEEYEVTQRQLRGNLPQAFVHALLFETSIRLHE